jgi:hypothetical protein
LNVDGILLDPITDGFDPFGLEQEMVVDEVDRPVAKLLEVLELGDYVSGTSRAPFATGIRARSASW